MYIFYDNLKNLRFDILKMFQSWNECLNSSGRVNHLLVKPTIFKSGEFLLYGEKKRYSTSGVVFEFCSWNRVFAFAKCELTWARISRMRAHLQKFRAMRAHLSSHFANASSLVLPASSVRQWPQTFPLSQNNSLSQNNCYSVVHSKTEPASKLPP